LNGIAVRFADRPARLQEVLEATEGRGFDLLLLFIGLPFLTPLAFPGLSTPFGLVAAFVGARLALGRRPWLPARLQQRQLPPRFTARVLGAATRVVRWLEALARPRLHFVHEQAVFQRLAGALVMSSGLLLALPLPIPLTNTFPALTIILVAVGALERDGLFFLAGCVMFAVTVAYFSLLAFGGAHALESLTRATFGK
jgi:hypothetical protein